MNSDLTPEEHTLFELLTAPVGAFFFIKKTEQTWDRARPGDRGMAYNDEYGGWVPVVVSAVPPLGGVVHEDDHDHQQHQPEQRAVHDDIAGHGTVIEPPPGVGIDGVGEDTE